MARELVESCPQPSRAMRYSRCSHPNIYVDPSRGRMCNSCSLLRRSRVNSQIGTRTTDEGRCLPGLRRTEQPSTCKIGCLSPVYLRVTRSAKSRTTSTSALVLVTPSYRHKQNKETSLALCKTKQNGDKTQLTCMVLHTRTHLPIPSSHNLHRLTLVPTCSPQTLGVRHDSLLVC